MWTGTSVEQELDDFVRNLVFDRQMQRRLALFVAKVDIRASHEELFASGNIFFKHIHRKRCTPLIVFLINICASQTQIHTNLIKPFGCCIYQWTVALNALYVQISTMVTEHLNSDYTLSVDRLKEWTFVSQFLVLKVNVRSLLQKNLNHLVILFENCF